MPAQRLKEPEEFGIPDRHYYCTNSQIVAELYEEATKIRTIADLLAYARTSSLPHLEEIFVPAILFFFEYKGRDGKKIRRHLDLGYGPRLTLDHEVDSYSNEVYSHDIGIGLRSYVEKCLPPFTPLLRDARVFGVTDYREIAYDLITLLDHRY